MVASLTWGITSALAQPYGNRVREVAGSPVITDGDTVIVADTKIRLQGVDAPETDQICLDHEGSDWNCGISARDALIHRAGKEIWRCQLRGSDAYGRALGTCFVEGWNINRWLVSEGWALAFRHYARTYAYEEDYAKAKKKGLWAGSFIAPWDWRHRNCDTQLHSLAPISIEAHWRLCGSPAQPPSTKCSIKGNLKPRACIYHLPGGRHYGKLSMEGPKRRWFCSEDEAIAVGCQRAKN